MVRCVATRCADGGAPDQSQVSPECQITLLKGVRRSEATKAHTFWSEDFEETRHAVFEVRSVTRARRSYEPLILRLRDRVLDGPGRLDTFDRQAAYSGEQVPSAIAWYVDKVRVEAHKSVEADFEKLRAAGYSDDEVFELTIATALGAGLSRLDAVFRAMEHEA